MICCRLQEITIRTPSLSSAVVAGLAALTSGPALASVDITFYQVGSDVVAIAAGSLDTSTLHFTSAISSVAVVQPDLGEYRGGSQSPGALFFSDAGSLSGPASLGPGTGLPHPASSASGDILGVTGLKHRLYVPDGYISGTALAHTTTWTQASFASLGLGIGSYVYTWGSGLHADSLTLTVSTAAIPEPASAGLALLGVLSLAAWMRRRG